MRNDDIRAIAQIGQALWANSEHFQKVSADILAAVSLLKLDQEASLERVSQTLLDRAIRDGVAVNASLAHLPFYRLKSEERFILSALYNGKWSYARLSRILRMDEQRIAEIAWAARLDLALQPLQSFYLPVGSSGESCPEFHPARPWPQKFFDGEVSRRERVFFETHALGCSSCRTSLNRCRQVYYSAASQVPSLSQELEQDLTGFLSETLELPISLKDPLEMTFLETLRIFLKRADVQAILLICLAWILFKLAH